MPIGSCSWAPLQNLTTSQLLRKFLSLSETGSFYPVLKAPAHVPLSCSEGPTTYTDLKRTTPVNTLTPPVRSFITIFKVASFLQIFRFRAYFLSPTHFFYTTPPDSTNLTVFWQQCTFVKMLFVDGLQLVTTKYSSSSCNTVMGLHGFGRDQA
jgi:hypothetical protein